MFYKNYKHDQNHIVVNATLTVPKFITFPLTENP